MKGGRLLFNNTREQCDQLAEEFAQNGHSCAIYRGDMDKKERRQNLKEFWDGKQKLVSSTVSRALDVESIDRVINYHLPKEVKNYLHPAGRNARAERKGTAVNFVTDRGLKLMKRLASKGPTLRSSVSCSRRNPPLFQEIFD